MIEFLALITLISRANALMRPDGVGRLPALGWSSWNAHECDINATVILTAAAQVVKLGLKDLGYEYINIDDCWSIKTHRDPTTNRMIPDADRFPDGIASVASQIHELGLKVGIYSSAGETTCAGYPASLGYEDIDAETFAEWEIDYLKYDDCGVPDNWKDPYTFCVPDTANNAGPFPNGTCPSLPNPAPANYNWSTSPSAERFRRMLDALNTQDRTILYSLCNWGNAAVNTWGAEIGNSWRMSGDISPGRGEVGPDRTRIAVWERIAEITNEMSFLVREYAEFWGWPDADMLEVGNGEGGMTVAENRAHFALWAAMRSPLLIGTKLDTIRQEHLKILKNPTLLTFHQDPIINRPAYPYKWGYNADYTFDAAHPAEYWSGPSPALEGTLVVMLNSENVTSTRMAVWSEVPELQNQDQGDAFEVMDGWTGEDLGCIKEKYEVELDAHDAAVLVVGNAC
uniref:Probable alpha-galactosidase B n=1 Tax=Emericella nidulans (strain FGSC A4 / ATCC 38163 / CBS 112.46 / NRRL 194 / M139) TaxID=227321 RepID=AGALB_EMENI|nr:RecName: Full=Probable alpha-galactosidase B; AltName: Full=Melibiase B; Flags: Precursor [Aspergillus nidulans FGSC A4]ABF50888.1 putative alpha-galactosidase [Aspergillus nidulans]